LNSALERMSEYEDFEVLNAVRSNIYECAVEIHEKTGNHAEALRFQKLFTANEARNHEKNKITAINDMSAKYDTELKQTRIETLTRENRAARQILWLVVGLSAALVVAGLSVILLGRARRKNIEQRLYETALLAELSPQMPVRETIEKIARQVTESAIDGATKTQYLERLERLDVPLLENLYRSSGGTLTGLDMKYIVCFAATLAVRDIGLLFSVEPASVNTVRYRIRKKFAPGDPFRLVI
jgi:hypothetical protein